MKGVVVTPFGGDPVPVTPPCTCADLPGGGRLVCKVCAAAEDTDDTRGHMADPDAIEVWDGDGEVD